MEVTTPKQALELEIIALFTGLGVKHVSCVTNEMSGGQYVETAYICHWNNQQYGEMRAEDVARSMLWMLKHVWKPITKPELAFAVLPGKEGKGFTVWYRWLEDENDEQSE